jgi:hypothetical protein
MADYRTVFASEQIVSSLHGMISSAVRPTMHASPLDQDVADHVLVLCHTPVLLSSMKFGSRFSRLYVSLSLRFGVSHSRFGAYLAIISSVFVTTLYVRHISSRDPGSLFFDPNTAYNPGYSAIRQQQAEHFVAAANDAPPYRLGDGAAKLCVGVPSIARDGARYLRTTVGSLLAGLTPEERDDIRLIAFIPHTQPDIHPAYHEPWLRNLVDQVLVYDLPQAELNRIAELEKDKGLLREKGLFDYTYLLKTCFATGTPYIAIIEDDVIAMDGWYHRTVGGIRKAESQSGLRTSPEDFLYLRLFYTEEFLGWNSESWRKHAAWSIAFIASCAGLVLWGRSRHPEILTLYLSLAICFGLVPWAVLLTFAAGRVTVFPLPAGVNEMNNFGCCAQGLVYPRGKAHDLIAWYEASRIGFADMLTEQYANEHGEQRWALTPSVLQHIGAKSSKADDFGLDAKHSKSVAQTIWNFAFELNQPTALRKESAALDPVSI